MQVYYSNRVESLLNALKTRLFTGSSPFKRRLLIVPSPLMKSWVISKLAAQVDIFMGVETDYLDSGFEKITQLLTEGFNLHSAVQGDACECRFNSRLPTLLELAAFAELEFKNMLHAGILPAELCRYLHPSDAQTLKSQKRTAKLSEQVARLFKQYALFAPRMLQSWEHSSNTHWQQILWQRVQQKYPEITFPEALVQTNQCLAKASPEIHLFAFSFIPASQLQFLAQASQYLSVHMYQLSPCAIYWEDISSDREALRLLHAAAQQNQSHQFALELEEYLQDRNPLLANLGKLGREMLKHLGRHARISDESYCLPETIAQYEHFNELLTDELILEPASSPPTLLEKIQADILLLRNPKSRSKECVEFTENSITLHIASGKKREVEILYDTLLKLTAGQGLYPEEILVMAPDISAYAPFIKAVFGAEASSLDYQIYDLQLSHHTGYMRAFACLLQLAESRWSAADVLELLEYQEVQKGLSFTWAELEIWKKWIISAEIVWGVDVAHRLEILMRNGCAAKLAPEFQGTWEHGFSRLMAGLLTKEEQQFNALPAFAIPIEGTKGVLLGKLLEVIRALRKDLAVLAASNEFTLAEWADFLDSLAEAYLISIDKQNESTALQLFTADLRQVSGKFEKTAKFPWQSIKRHLQTYLSQKNLNYRENHLRAIRFCSLLPMRAIPAKVIYLLGMSEEAFPRQAIKDSLNLMAGNQLADYNPAPSDFDRYLFLEALLSARKQLLISYPKCSEQDKPSILVSELFQYLDEGYAIDGKPPSKALTITHPFTAYSAQCFSGEGHCSSSSQFNFGLAKAALTSKERPFCFAVANSEANPLQVKEGKTSIDLADLRLALKNPLKCYLKNTLQLSLKESAEEPQEKLALHPLDLYQIWRGSLTQTIPAIIERCEKRGELPVGIFKQAAKNQVEKNISDWIACCASIRLEAAQIMAVELDAQASAAVKQANCYKLPAIKMRVKDCDVEIAGKLEFVAPQGLLLLAEKKEDKIAENLADILLYGLIVRQLPEEYQAQIIWVKSALVQPYPIEQSEIWLGKVVEYYWQACQTPHLSMPKWLTHLLKQDYTALNKKIYNADFQKEYLDRYAVWSLGIHAKSMHLDEGLFAKGCSVVKQLHEPLLNIFKGKK